MLILNSTLVDILFRKLNSNTQVSAGEINNLPIKLPQQDDEIRLVNLYKEIRRNIDDHIYINQIQDNIDDVIYRLYSISEDEKFILNNSDKYI